MHFSIWYNTLVFYIKKQHMFTVYCHNTVAFCNIATIWHARDDYISLFILLLWGMMGWRWFIFYFLLWGKKGRRRSIFYFLLWGMIGWHRSIFNFLLWGMMGWCLSIFYRSDAVYNKARQYKCIYSDIDGEIYKFNVCTSEYVWTI